MEKEKVLYAAPEAEALVISTENTICQTSQQDPEYGGNLG